MQKTETIGARIKKLRKDHKVSAEKLAAAIGKTAKTVVRWETGENSPRWEDIEAIALHFGVQPDRLTRGLGARPTESAA